MYFHGYEKVKENDLKNSRDYLAEALEKLPGNTDGEKAKALKIAGSTLSQYKSGKQQMDDFACIMVARVLGIDAMKIIAACQEEREKNEERREFWRDFRSTLGSWIAAALAFVLLTMATSNQAMAASQIAENVPYDKCLLCQICAVVSYATTPRSLSSIPSLFKYHVYIICNR